jgi:DNA-binding NarL/FixJ family response regulator
MRISEGLCFKGKVLLVTAELCNADAAKFLRQGIAGIFPKQSPPELLSDAIRKVLAGMAWFEQSQLEEIVRSAVSTGGAARSGQLTERERQVLSFVFQGKTNHNISELLQVSETSVETTLRRLFQKTGAHTRSQLVRIALEQYKDQL